MWFTQRVKIRFFFNFKFFFFFLNFFVWFFRRQVTISEAEEFAKENNLIFVECSAKTGFNIDKLFKLSSQVVMERIVNGEINFNDEVNFKFKKFVFGLFKIFRNNFVIC